MNFGSDHRVRDAFRATLDEKSSVSILGTQEIDAADVLEVTDLANAIARAEEALRARSSRALANPESSRSSDIFDSLVASSSSSAGAAASAKAATSAKDSEPTDDASGPALHVPYRPTPLPPRGSAIPLPPGVTRPATLLRAPEALTPVPARVSSTPLAPAQVSSRIVTPVATVSVNATQPLPAVAVPPAQQTAPILILDEDAFYHPAGRIRTMAEGTLDGFRPEPTLLVRLRQRRNTLSWVVLLVLAPVLLIALFAAAVVVGRATVPNAVPATTAPVVTTSPAPTMAVPALTTTAAATTPPTVAATSAATTPPTVAATSAARTTPAVTTPKASEQASVRTSTSGDATATPASNIPVFDVNSLKSVPALPAKTRR